MPLSISLGHRSWCLLHRDAPRCKPLVFRHGVHDSTSWRYCHRTDRLLLTYLVVLPQRAWGCWLAERGRMVAQQVGKEEAVRGDHLRPPGRIEMNSVLAHALDHLAWLKCYDERIKAVLESGWGVVLETRRPRPAGYVSQTCQE